MYSPIRAGCSERESKVPDEDHGAAPEWPVIDADLAERVRLRKRWFTPEFFNRTVGNSFDGACVERVKFRRARLLGLSGSWMRRCDLTLSDRRVIAVVMKAARKGLAQEALFYCDLAPHVPVRIPRPYGLAPNPEPGGRDILIIEALPSPLAPSRFNARHVHAIAQAIAKLHASFMASEALEVTGWLPNAARLDREIFTHRINNALDALRSREKRMRYFPAKLGDAGERIVRAAAARIDSLMEPLQSMPPTLLHGDLNPNNIIIPENAADTCEPEQIAFVDWQNVAIGPAVLDIAYLHHMSRYHGNDRWGRAIFGEPLTDWNELAANYLDALDREMGRPFDREAFMAAAPAADAVVTLRSWVPLCGLAVAAGNADFLWGRMGWLFRPLLRWARIDELFAEFLDKPVQRLDEECDTGFSR